MRRAATDTTTTARFYELLWPHLPHVLRVAQILTGNAADAEDLAQETMLKAFRAIDQFRAGSDAKSWLMTILRNARIDRIRSRSAEARDISLDALDYEPAQKTAESSSNITGDRPNPDELLEAFADSQIIAAMQRLPEDIRWTLLLVDVEEMDHADAAALLEVPVGTIKSRVHRGRAMLRESLSKPERVT